MKPYTYLSRLGSKRIYRGGKKVATDMRGFAERHGLEYTQVWRQVTGRRPPQFKVVAAMYLESKGAVGIPDWLAIRPAIPKRRRKV